jgi:ABC-type multidrug transport system fused ATPase/permease subunit
LATSEKFGDGIPFVIWALIWLLGGVMAIVLSGYDILHPFIDRLPGRDFTNLWTAGKLVWSGQAGCAFDVNCFRLAEFDYLHLLGLQNYSYPPSALFVAAPFALLPYPIALAIWTVAGIYFFVRCAKPYLPKGFPAPLAAFTPAATINIWNGHYGFLLGGLWLLFFQSLEKQPNRAGLFAGLLTLKPHLGLMIATTVMRKRQALIAAMLTVAVLFLASVVAFGAAPWIGFIFGTTATQHEILTRTSQEFYFRMMPSAYVAFGRGNSGLIAQIASAVGAVAFLIRYRTWDAFSAATATFLIIPYAFNYDMTVACLGFVILLYARWGALTLFERAILILAFLSPEITFYAPWIIPPVLLVVLNIQLRPESDRKKASDLLVSGASS